MNTEENILDPDFSESHGEEKLADNESDEEDVQESETGDQAASSLETLERIEHLTLNILEQIIASLKNTQRDQELDRLSIAGRSHKQKEQRIEIQIADRRKDSATGFATRVLRYPGWSKGPSSRPIAQLLQVMNRAHEAVSDELPLTKRDLYYRDVSLFKSQQTVDKLVDDLAATLDLNRADLNIRSTSKGLVCGSGLLIHLSDGEILCVNDSEGTLIPPGEDIERFEVESDVKWVLIVEKEAVFQTLCRLQFCRHPGLPGGGIIITGKGYPDVATRQLVKTLSDNLPNNIPILGLVDGDAYGLDIMSVYKQGSQSLRHENEKLAAHRVQWLGIRASELTDLDIPRDALIPITKHDEKKAMSMLRLDLPVGWRRAICLPYPRCYSTPTDRQELMRILHTRRKAEIEILTSGGSGSQGDEICRGIPWLVRYLSHRILHFIEMSST